MKGIAGGRAEGWAVLEGLVAPRVHVADISLTGSCHLLRTGERSLLASERHFPSVPRRDEEVGHPPGILQKGSDSSESMDWIPVTKMGSLKPRCSSGSFVQHHG